MKNIAILTGLTLSVALLTACGGGSGSSGSSSSGSSTGGSSTGGSSTGGSSTGGSSTGGSSSGGVTTSVNGNSPVTPLTQNISRTFEIAGQDETYSYGSGYSGDLVTDLSQGFFAIKLKSGLSQMVVNDVQQQISIDYTCANGDSAKGTVEQDLSSGQVVFSATVNGTAVNCTETYPSPLPITLTAESDIEDLLDEWDGGSPTSSTCPADLEDETDSPFLGATTCDGDFLTNITVKDDANKTHKVSNSISF